MNDKADNAGIFTDIIKAIALSVHSMVSEAPKIGLGEHVKKNETKEPEHENGKNPDPGNTAKSKTSGKDRLLLLRKLAKRVKPRVMKKSVKISSTKGKIYQLVANQHVWVIPLQPKNLNKSNFVVKTSKPFHLVHVNGATARGVVMNSILASAFKSGTYQQNTGNKSGGPKQPGGNPSGKRKAKPNANRQNRRSQNGNGTTSAPGASPGNNGPATPHAASPANNQGQHSAKPVIKKPPPLRKAVRPKKFKHITSASETLLFQPVVNDHVRVVGNKSGDTDYIVRHIKDGCALLMRNNHPLGVSNDDITVIGRHEEDVNGTKCTVWIVNNVPSRKDR